jgi:hypothetical protein
MNAFRRAVRWWVFLPVAPILVALVSNYSEELFRAVGLTRLAWAAHGVFILDCFALLPYMAFDSAVIGMGSLGPYDSVELLMLLLLIPAMICCVLLYAISFMLQKPITGNRI